jgi:hypothetical protein
MTVAQRKQCHIALEQTGGSVCDAARLLGVSEETLSREIEENPELQSYGECSQPSAEETVKGPPLPAPLMSEAMSRANMMREDERNVALAVIGAGVTSRQLGEVMGFYRLGIDHFNSIRHCAYGGLAASYFRLMEYQKVLIDEIKEAKNKGDTELESIRREDFSRIANCLNQTFDRMLQAWKIQVGVEAAKAASAKQGEVRRKPGFAPLQMAVAGNVTVHQPSSVPALPQPPPAELLAAPV